MGAFKTNHRINPAKPLGFNDPQQLQAAQNCHEPLCQPNPIKRVMPPGMKQESARSIPKSTISTLRKMANGGK